MSGWTPASIRRTSRKPTDGPRRRLPMGRLAGLAAVAVALFVVFHGAGGLRFKSLRPGLEFALMRGEPYCRSGSAQVAVLRVDPARLRLQVRHYSRERTGQPPNVLEWRRRTNALAVFNAGQYYPDYSYMGLLVSGGEAVSKRLHASFQGLLVASPVTGDPAAHVLDLTEDSLDVRNPGWREVAQSFMLFDRSGRTRVRKSNQIANRTVVAEDHQGRLLVIVSEGGYTLYEFTSLLRGSPLRLSHAMAMDGGYEAELCVQVGDFRYASFGRWDGESDVDVPGARTPLPAVVTVSAE